MTEYVGIDLGTTNSAIATYDGTRCRVRKSTQYTQDVTPSVVFYGRRGKFVGAKAYENAFMDEGRAAQLFKRKLGTQTRIELTEANVTLTPEECSAEILRTLWSYLPEEIRSAEPGTVITVPAAFNQMQTRATQAAATAAGLSRVALLQEPVAAVMSVLQQTRGNGMFMVYDLGGGTLDIAIAEAYDGHVNLLAHGGIQVHGGRDWDRAIVDNVVLPWLREHYSLPEKMRETVRYKQLLRAITRRAEQAKIALSAHTETGFEPLEGGHGYRDIEDEDGEVIELEEELVLDRNKLDDLIEGMIEDSVTAARNTLKEAGVENDDVERIVFVGGPTNYGPLREAVCFQLGIRGSTEVNTMTAVAEGAAIYAESVDWEGSSVQRKSERGTTTSREATNVEVVYTKRAAGEQGRIQVKMDKEAAAGATLEVTSETTGWNSGQIGVAEGGGVQVPLPKWGENTFRITVRDRNGNEIGLTEETVTIMRTAATVEGIPASHSIGIEVQERIGGSMSMDWLVRKGDNLPMGGTRSYRAAIRVRENSTDSLRFKLWEGELEDAHRNRPIGTLRIEGTDLAEGQIEKGAELECSYAVDTGGAIRLTVEVPSLGTSFGGGKDFYAYQEGQVDLHRDRLGIADEARRTLEEGEGLDKEISSEALAKALEKLRKLLERSVEDADTEEVQELREAMLEARTAIGTVRQKNRAQTRQMDLDGVVELFDNTLREVASPTKQRQIDTLVRTAQEAIDEDDRDFEGQINELRRLLFGLLWEVDGFVVEMFVQECRTPQKFSDQKRFWRLAAEGKKAVERGDIDHLRQHVLPKLEQIKYAQSSSEDMVELANILRG